MQIFFVKAISKVQESKTVIGLKHLWTRFCVTEPALKGNTIICLLQPKTIEVLTNHFSWPALEIFQGSFVHGYCCMWACQ